MLSREGDVGAWVLLCGAWVLLCGAWVLLCRPRPAPDSCVRQLINPIIIYKDTTGMTNLMTIKTDSRGRIFGIS